MGVELATERTGYSGMEDVNFTDSELVCHVREALRSVSLGDSDGYNQLIGVIHHSERLAPDEVALLVTSLKALAGAVSCFDNIYHESLLSSIFGMSMWNYGPDVMDALVELIISLAVSTGKYIDSCLDMLVSNFMPPYSFLQLLSQPRGRARKGQVLDRVHAALKDISDLVPLAPVRLLPIILQKMPNVFTKEPLMVMYVENMLRLESGSMGALVGDMMLLAVVDRLIDLDLEIEWEDILQDDFSKGMFEMELEDVEESLDDDEPLRESSSGRSFRGNAIAEKLDSLLVVMFEHLKSCNDAGRLVKVFETLLQSFQMTVLSAYKSKFAQFVMFYACSLDPEHCGMRFADFLADIFTDSDSIFPPLKRMSAVAYLASYLSRAKFLSVSFVMKTLQRLVSWCWRYSENQDGDINPKAHRVFYSGCQAVMYVLCFRLRAVMGVPGLKSQLSHMKIDAILKHPLNSLEVCLPSIVEEFLRQAKAAHLFTTVSETFVFNNLLESDHSRAFGGMERLDMFFPFDPCLMKKSDRFIRPNYIYWSMVRATYDEDEEGFSDEDVIEEDFMVGSVENFAGDLMAGSCGEHDSDLDDFLSKMSITPENPSNFRFGGELHAAMRMPSRIRPSTSPESL